MSRHCPIRKINTLVLLAAAACSLASPLMAENRHTDPTYVACKAGNSLYWETRGVLQDNHGRIFSINLGDIQPPETTKINNISTTKQTMISPNISFQTFAL